MQVDNSRAQPVASHLDARQSACPLRRWLSTADPCNLGNNILDTPACATYIVRMRKKQEVVDPTKPYVPQTLQDAIAYFADEEVAHAFAVTMRWPDGVFCPYCQCCDY